MEDTASLLYLEPLSGFILGYLLLGERLSAVGIGATIVLIAGVLIAHPIHSHRFMYFRSPHHKHHEGLAGWLREKTQTVEHNIAHWI